MRRIHNAENLLRSDISIAIIVLPELSDMSEALDNK
jgi:hypothetical protein